MSKKKPEKQLVSKGRYVQVMGKKVGLYSFAGLLGVICLYLFIGVVFTLWMMAHEGADYFQFKVVITMLIGSLVLYRLSKKLVLRGKKIESVTPVTDRNAHLLPVEESLLRGCDPPSMQSQKELLRAAASGKQTPPEELLRAAKGEGQE